MLEIISEWTAKSKIQFRCVRHGEDYEIQHDVLGQWENIRIFQGVTDEIAHLVIENSLWKSDNARLALRVKELEGKNG